MTFETEGERLLFASWKTADDLRKAFPYIGDLLEGEFGLDGSGQPKFNVYENGRVVSRNLVQFAVPPIKNPTVGIILPGRYEFPTGDNTETLTILEGNLEAFVDRGPISILKRYGTIVAPAGTILNLRVQTHDPVFYVCIYTPRKVQAGETR